MSEPVKNAEIEDVLSSIRRLVSGENRPAPDASAPRPRPADRLVLTPALRVAEPSEPSEPEATPQDDAPADSVDHAETAPWSDPEATLYDAARGAETHDDPRHDSGEETAWQDDAAQGSMAGDHGDGDAQEVPHHTAEAGEDSRSGASDDLGARIAALEEVIARKDDQWEPDTPGSDDYAGTEVETLEWEDTSDAEPRPEPEPHAEPEDDDDAPDLLAEDPVLDEAALRDLVAEIVRQELQGALGERITRNVRKLVRREIQRAMTLQDLE